MAKKILLVDDDIDFVEITKSQLRKGSYDVEVAYNGEECLEKVKKGKPDLIIMDVMMPVVNGYEACEILKSDERTKSIPVILLTAVAKNVTKTTYTPRQGMETEADDYIPKPPVYEDLIKSINALI
jgi:two-component system alkaline phosphatase synthesis response regulator PhoP